MDGYTLSQATINSIGIAIFGAAMTFIASWFWHTKNQAIKEAELKFAEQAQTAAVLAVGHQAVLDRLTELEAKERAAAQVINPIVTAFQTLLIQKLTHDLNPEMDRLMVKVGPPDILTEAERERLHVLLHERTTNMDSHITAEERDAARILPIVMKMAAAENARFGTVENAPPLQMVTIVSITSTNEDHNQADSTGDK